MRIGFDNDGCLSDFARSYYKAVGIPFRGEPCCWDFYKHDGHTVEQFVEYCNKAADDGILFTGEPRPGAVEAVNRVKTMGHTTIMITDRAFGSSPEVSQKITYAWIEQYGFHFDEVYFSANKLISPTHMFVEDKLENYDRLDAAAVEVYLINRPWNRKNDFRRRINNITDYAQAVADRTLSLV